MRLELKWKTPAHKGHGQEFWYSADLLERVKKAALELPFRGVHIALRINPAKCAAGRVRIRIIQVRMVEIVECLGTEDQLVVLVAGNDMHPLLQSRTEALEASAVDGITRATRCEGARCGAEIDAGIEPLIRVLASGELMVEPWGLAVSPKLIARPWPDARIIIALRNIKRTARLALDGSGELPVAQRTPHRGIGWNGWHRECSRRS